MSQARQKIAVVKDGHKAILGFKNMLPVQNRKFHCPSFLTLT
jgi:hypothetical protein